MIFTITLNPAWDVTYAVAVMQAGTTHRVQTVSARAGGKGLNVSRVVRQVGVPTLANANAGGSTGDLLVADTAAAQLPTAFLRCQPRPAGPLAR